MIIGRILFTAVLVFCLQCASAKDKLENCFAVIEWGAAGQVEQVVEACDRLYQDIISTPPADGEAVKVTGYVAEVDGEPYLFPSKDIYFYSAGKGGVALIVPLAEREMFNRTMLRGLPMTVIGRYYAATQQRRHLSPGRIEVISDRYWSQAMPGETPIPPVEWVR